MKHLFITTAAFVVTARVASAEPEPPEDRNADTALTLSIVGTAVPVAAIGLGLSGVYKHDDVNTGLVVGGALVGLITPALGEISSHRWVTRGMGVRAAGLGIATFGAIGMIVSSEDGDPEIPPSRTSVGVVVVGAALYLGGAILDIVDAPGAARAWNARHPQRFVVAPTVLHTQHSSAAGVALGFGF